MSNKLILRTSLVLPLLLSSTALYAADASPLPAVAKFGISFMTAGAQLYEAGTAPSVVPADADKATLQVGSLVDRYKREMKSNAAAADLAKATGELVIGTAVIVGSSTGVGAVPSAIVGSLATWGNDAFAGYLQAEGKKAAQQVLANGLSEWDASSGVKYDDIKKMIEDGKTDEAAAQFHEAAGALTFMNSELADFPGGKEVAEKLLFKTIADTTRSTLEQTGKNTADIKTLQANLKATKQIMDATGERMDAMNDRLTNIETDLTASISSMDRLARSNEQQLGMINDVLYGQQPTAIKLEMLKDPKVKAGLTGQARDDLIQVLKTQKIKEDIIKDSGEIVGNIQGINSIMHSLNLGSPEIDTAVNIASVAQNAMAQALTGNYIGAIAGALSVFGGSKPSPEQQYFNAIMGKLDQIDQKLTTVIQLQQKTLEAIQGLSKQLADVEERLNKRLDTIQIELQYVAANVQSLMWENVRSCGTAYGYRTSNGEHYNDQTESFDTTADLFKYMSVRGQEALECATQLENLFLSVKNQKVFGNALSLKAAPYNSFPIPQEQKEKADKLRTFLEEVNNRAFDVFTAGWKTEWGNKVNGLALLGSPAATSKGVRSRLDEISKSPKSACSEDTLLSPRLRAFFCSSKFALQEAPKDIDIPTELNAIALFEPLMLDPILRDQMPTLIKWTSFAARPYDLRRTDDKTKSYTNTEDLVKSGYPYGKELILSALDIVDIAIAQQAMLHGDMTAKFVYDALWDKNTNLPSIDADTDAAKLFSNVSNPWLAENVLMFFMEDGLDQNMKVQDIRIPYTNALAPFFDPALKPDEQKYVGRTFLKSLFHFPDTVDYEVREEPDPNKTKRVYIIFPGKTPVAVRMPSPEDMNSRTLTYPESLLALMRQREMLVERYVDYDLLANAASAEDLSVAVNVLLHQGEVR
ncbi:hypothetical protein AMC87_CH02886 [Rhizobium phaseoli]|uniref:hypothetical protein n=1 Tax=Rhizobium phaseoli TaxID=396 RepID=UPI0007EA13D3|nr:hypothetical protein [Rhizobium phaseoli]ANL47552.1 hypothetical protein AMC87_CH02886 [Rhizobium phaseoli]